MSILSVANLCAAQHNRVVHGDVYYCVCLSARGNLIKFIASVQERERDTEQRLWQRHEIGYAADWALA